MFNKPLFALSALALVFASPNCLAANFSFTDTFSTDADVQLIHFSLLEDNTDVVIKTLSLNGGTNVAGNSITSVGFAPYLALYKQADGNWIHDTLNKNGGDEAVMAGCGNYLLALTQYDNVAAGVNLEDGFAASLGLASFNGTPFTFNGGGGSGHWAVDIHNIDAVSLPPSQVPIPGAGVLLLSGLLSLTDRPPQVENQWLPSCS